MGVQCVGEAPPLSLSHLSQNPRISRYSRRGRQVALKCDSMLSDSLVRTSQLCRNKCDSERWPSFLISCLVPESTGEIIWARYIKCLTTVVISGCLPFALITCIIFQRVNIILYA